ncbi:hypothetical protein AB0H23_31755 [Streptomyces albogriseolus]|uniref:hypothetical protein n=1 Tax=Streptomyces albogriseolus TaxID=1887 RepID=UPI003460BF1F
MTDAMPITRSLPVLVDTVGRAQLGHHPGPAPRSAPLYVCGGLLIVDPFAPDLAPYAEVDATEGEGAWLPLAYGEDVARTLRATRRSAAKVPVSADDPAGRVLARDSAPWRPGLHHTPLARLAVLMWLARWAPFPLSPALLDIEAGTLLAALPDVVEDAEDTARDLLVRRAPDLAAIATSVLDRGVLAGEHWVAALLRDALTATAHLAEDLPLAPRLRDLADRACLEAGEDNAADTMDSELRRLIERVPAYEGTTLRRADGWRIADVDWAQVPPNAVASHEGAIRWRLQGSGEDTGIEVGVDAADQYVADPVGDRLAFRVYTPTRPLPVAIGALEHGAASWRGTARLREPVHPDRLHVDVYHPAWASPVRSGVAAALAAAERQAVRDLMVLRTHLARDDRRQLVRWAEIVGADTAARLTRIEEEHGLDPLTARVDGLVRAALAAAGNEPPDPANPQLASSEWRPTLAEWSRLRPLFPA